MIDGAPRQSSDDTCCAVSKTRNGLNQTVMLDDPTIAVAVANAAVPQPRKRARDQRQFQPRFVDVGCKDR